METFEQLRKTLIQRIAGRGKRRTVSGRVVKELMNVPVSIPPDFVPETLDDEKIEYILAKLDVYENDIKICEKKLRNDRTSRQAVVQFDTTGDFPNCTVSIHFQIREDMLTTTVFQRSMDVENKFDQDYEIIRRMSERLMKSLDCEWRGAVFHISNAHFYTS